MNQNNDVDRCPKEGRKAWIAPKATSEKVRDITAGNPAHFNGADGTCRS